MRIRIPYLRILHGNLEKAENNNLACFLSKPFKTMWFDLLFRNQHVDDIIFAGKTDEEIAKGKESITERFQAKDMGELKYILGL